MAFQRDYMNAGDPFRFRLPKLKHLRLPKAVRKFQPGRALKSLAPIAASLVGSPLLGGAVAAAESVAERKAALRAEPDDQPLPEEIPDDTDDTEGLSLQDQFLQFARSYGLIAGDPRPGGKKPSKLGQAAAQPSAHAKQKRKNRAAKHASGPKQASSARGHAFGATKPTSLGQKAAAALKGLQGFDPRNPASALSLLTGSSDPNKILGLGGGGHRRSMNPTNVKALRRSLRRLEGFDKIVARVRKLVPKLRHLGAASTHHCPPATHHKRRAS